MVWNRMNVSLLSHWIAFSCLTIKSDVINTRIVYKVISKEFLHEFIRGSELKSSARHQTDSRRLGLKTQDRT